MNTLDILIARVEDLSDALIIHAAKRGLLANLLTRTSLADDDDHAWADIWAAHTAAGHGTPEYTHTSDDDSTSERGIVWGCDTLTAFGATHEVGWSANYGGNNPGWNGIRHDDWVVEEDGEGVSTTACLAAMAEAYDIDLTDGQPSAPSSADCEREKSPSQTVWVVCENNGKLEKRELEIFRWSHPIEHVEEDENADDSPFPHYYDIDDSVIRIEDAAECRTLKECRASIRAHDSVRSLNTNEDVADSSLLRRLTNLATDAHGAPEHFTFILPEWEDEDGRNPYILPLDGEDVEEDRYHLDAEELQEVIDSGWRVLTPALTAAFGKRVMLAALRDRQEQADSILAEKADAVWVSLVSSYGAGNCRQGTASFLRDRHLDPACIGGVTASYLLEAAPKNPHVLRACRLAALGIH